MKSNQEALVRFVDIQKSYDGKNLVVKGFNLDLAQGEFLTMLGPSGSGKTTCLMMLAGFESPTHGEIFLNGKSINRVPPHKRDIGMVFQNYALFPHMSVAENLAFPLKVRRLKTATISEKVAQALDMVQMLEFSHRRPAQLSGGQQQRIAVARALIFDPQLVLMDEPLGALDKNLREEMQYEIKLLHQRLGISIVYVTHDQSEALTMSDRIAVFNEGIVQQVATPKDLYEAPANAFVARFIGENNTLNGKVSALTAGSCTVETGAGVFITALPVGVSSVGVTTTLSLRPERVQIRPVAGSVPNIFEAKIQELIYLGDHIRSRIEICGNKNFIVKIPNDNSCPIPQIGDKISVGWAAEDCRAL